MATPRLRKDYRSPLNIPEGKSGDYSITHEIVPAGKGVMLSNERTALFGQSNGCPQSISFGSPTRWHSLHEGGNGTWMTDYPIEQRQHDMLLRGMAGTVLVGGLGLGYAVTVLARRKTVRKIVVVEIGRGVINLVAPHLQTHGKVEFVHDDLFTFLKNYHEKPFDHAFFDIWSSDGESTFHHTVVPLLALSEGKVVASPRCWNEDIMRGQLRLALESQQLRMLPEYTTVFPEYAKLPPLWEEDGSDRPWHNWSVPFWKWVRMDNPDNKAVRFGALVYSSIYGLSGWEQVWREWSGVAIEHKEKGEPT